MTVRNTEKFLSIDESHQLYLLEWNLEMDTEIVIGKLGSFLFQKGIYVYVGSARKNIKARVSRHLKLDKKKKWHMDYFRPYVNQVKAITFPLYKGECSLKEFVEETFQGEVLIKGFGSSDCKCNSHLLKLPTTITIAPDTLRRKWKK